VERPVVAARDQSFERLLVGVEAVAHRHRQPAAGRANAVVDACTGLHRPGERLLAEHVATVRERELDQLLVVRRRHDDDREVRLALGERPRRVRVAALRLDPVAALRERERLGVRVDRGGRRRSAGPDEVRQECVGPTPAPPAGADVDEAERAHAWILEANRSRAVGRRTPSTRKPQLVLIEGGIRCHPSDHARERSYCCARSSSRA
jgi:hypothetical protein